MSIEHRFLERSRYYLRNEYLPKIEAAMAALPDDALWSRANGGSNAIGNLMLHLAGNVRQWLTHGVGGAPDERDRQAEFERDGGATREELVRGLRDAVEAADAAMAGMSTATLLERRTIQGRDVSVFEAIYHAVEHFAGHTGQIILLAKQAAPEEVRFYTLVDGQPRGRWSGADH